MGLQPGAPVRGDDRHAQSSILGDLRQRRILAILLEQAEPTPVRKLGVQLAARETGVAPSDITESEFRPIRVDLEHRCLPKLAAVGWVDRTPDGVVAVEPLSIDSGKLSLPDLKTPEDPDWEPVSVLLVHPRRQTVISLLTDHQRITVAELVDELLTRGESTQTCADAEQRLMLTLHHVALPKLADIDLIEYDTESQTVTRTERLVPVANRTGLATG